MTELRALPIGLAPMNRETIGSYLHRLADANHITSTTLAQLLDLNRRHRRSDDDPAGWTAHTITRLAVLTDRPVTTLAQALPALRPLAPESGPSAPHGPTAACVACRYCAARKGIHGLVIQQMADHDRICLDHRRWLHGPEQHDLRALPELCTANRRHRRLRRRHDDIALHTALNRARDLVHDWLEADDQADLQQHWTRRLGRLRYDPTAEPYRPNQYRVELATYPEVVRLAALLAAEPQRTTRSLQDETKGHLARR
jgi:TniQ protein